MNSKFLTLTRKFVVFSVLLALVFGSLAMAGATPASAQELAPQTPAGEPVHYIVDEAGNVRISPVPPTKAAGAPAATAPNAACTNAPTLVSPANGSVLNTLIPELQYFSKNEPNADSLRVQWSTTPDFSSSAGMLWTWPGSTSWKMASNLQPATTYYWRAWFVCDDEAGSSSSVWSFTTGSGGIVPAATTLIAPANGSTVVTPATLEWQPVNGASFYQVMWREVGWGGYTFTSTNETSFELSWWAETDVEYEWWVRAANDYAYSTPSATWTFELIEPTFPDVLGNHWACVYIERLANAGITSGFPDGTFKPTQAVTRGQMAVFLLKAMNFPAAYSPPDVEATFSDTDSHWAKIWIEALRASGITGGFPDGSFRPENPVTRAQMAIFLLKALNGPGYEPPPATATFDDTAEHWASDWIEALRASGLTGGYPDGTFRPDQAVTRAEMAVFIVNAFGLP